MLVDLVRTTTSDGVRLDGALLAGADSKKSPWAVDAFLLVHGTGTNFYSSSLLEAVGGKLAEAGSAVLYANTRGHDLLTTGATKAGPRRQGAAVEVVDDGRYDLAAWVSLLESRGHRRVGIIGHSLGAIKGICLMAEEPPPGVACLVAISPARLSYRYFLKSSRGEDFRRTIEAAEEQVRAGRGETLMQVEFPYPYTVTAAGYLDKYGPRERYNVLPLVGRLRIPTLCTFGSVELANDVVFSGLPEDIENTIAAGQSVSVQVVAGADHAYSGLRGELNARVENWLTRTLSSVPRDLPA